MRKVIFNKWFLLSALLVLSLSAFSFVAYKKTRQVCNLSKECTRQPVKSIDKGEMLMDAASRQFSSLISFQ